MMDFEIVNTDWAKELQQDYSEYINACFESIDEDDHFATISDEYFCGCETCVVREQLCFLVPKIIDAYKKGFVKLTTGE
jgi:hypothetical protein